MTCEHFLDLLPFVVNITGYKVPFQPFGYFDCRPCTFNPRTAPVLWQRTVYVGLYLDVYHLYIQEGVLVLAMESINSYVES